MQTYITGISATEVLGMQHTKDILMRISWPRCETKTDTDRQIQTDRDRERQGAKKTEGQTHRQTNMQQNFSTRAYMLIYLTGSSADSAHNRHTDADIFAGVREKERVCAFISRHNTKYRGRSFRIHWADQRM